MASLTKGGFLKELADSHTERDARGLAERVYRAMGHASWKAQVLAAQIADVTGVRDVAGRRTCDPAGTRESHGKSGSPQHAELSGHPGNGEPCRGGLEAEAFNRLERPLLCRCPNK